MEMQRSYNAGGTCVCIFDNTYIHVERETLDLLLWLRKIIKFLHHPSSCI